MSYICMKSEIMIVLLQEYTDLKEYEQFQKKKVEKCRNKRKHKSK